MSRGNSIREFDFPCVNNLCLTKALHAPENRSSTFTPLAPIFPVAANDVATAVSGAGAGAAADWHGDAEPAANGGGGGASERDRLVWAMEQCGWVQAKAARLLSLTPRQMGYALQKHNIAIKRF